MATEKDSGNEASEEQEKKITTGPAGWIMERIIVNGTRATLQCETAAESNEDKTITEEFVKTIYPGMRNGLVEAVAVFLNPSWANKKLVTTETEPSIFTCKPEEEEKCFQAYKPSMN